MIFHHLNTYAKRKEQKNLYLYGVYIHRRTVYALRQLWKLKESIKDYIYYI